MQFQSFLSCERNETAAEVFVTQKSHVQRYSAHFHHHHHHHEMLLHIIVATGYSEEAA